MILNIIDNIVDGLSKFGDTLIKILNTYKYSPIFYVIVGCLVIFLFACFARSRD